MSADNCGCDPDISYRCERHVIESLTTIAHDKLKLAYQAGWSEGWHAGKNAPDNPKAPWIQDAMAAADRWAAEFLEDVQ